MASCLTGNHTELFNTVTELHEGPAPSATLGLPVTSQISWKSLVSTGFLNLCDGYHILLGEVM